MLLINEIKFHKKYKVLVRQERGVMYFSLREVMACSALTHGTASRAAQERSRYDLFTLTPVCSKRLIFINAIGISRTSSTARNCNARLL